MINIVFKCIPMEQCEVESEINKQNWRRNVKHIIYKLKNVLVTRCEKCN